MIIHADDTNFKVEIEDTTSLVVVDFSAAWCGPCQMFGPIFEEVSNEYSNVKFIKVDVQTAQKTAAEAGVMSIPTIVFIKNGKEVERRMGLMPKETLKSRIDELKGGGEEDQLDTAIKKRVEGLESSTEENP